MKHIVFTILFSCVAVSAATVPLLSTTPTRRVSPDPVNSEGFGGDAAISGDTAVVGCTSATTNGVKSGAAFVYIRVATGWKLQQKLTPSDGENSDLFGNRVAIEGDTIVIGAYGDDGFAGSAYVFTRTAGVWTQQTKLLWNDRAAGDSGNNISCAISGNTIALGTTGSTIAGKTAQGAAYIFVGSGANWTQQAKLITSNGLANDNTGFSIGISGDTVVVGAHNHNSGGVTEAGAAYVFVRSGVTWTEQQQLEAPVPQMSAFLGFGVSISGDSIVVGAIGHDTAGVSNTGRAYVFVRSGVTWTVQQELQQTDVEAADNFGIATKIEGDTAIIGGYGDAGFRGASYVFVRSGTTWTQQQKLVDPNGVANDQFGAYGIGLSGNKVISTSLFSPGFTQGTSNSQGALFIYEEPGALIDVNVQVVEVSVDRNPIRTGQNASFSATAAPADPTNVFKWGFFDSNGNALPNSARQGNPVTFAFSNEGVFYTIVRVVTADGQESQDFKRLDVFPLAPNSLTEVENILVGKPPVFNPADNTQMTIPDSFTGVVDIDLSVKGALSRAGETFETDLPKRVSKFTGSKTAEKFDKPGISVVTTTRKTNGAITGRVKRMIPISAREAGTAQAISGREIEPPLEIGVRNAKPKGKFTFGKVDSMTLSGEIMMPKGVNMSEGVNISVGLGNVVTDLVLPLKGKPTVSAPYTKFSLKVSKLPKSKVTAGGETAKFSMTISAAKLDEAGFDTEGIRKKVESKDLEPLSIQCAFVVAGITYYSPINVMYKFEKGVGQISLPK